MSLPPAERKSRVEIEYPKDMLETLHLKKKYMCFLLGGMKTNNIDLVI